MAPSAALTNAGAALPALDDAAGSLVALLSRLLHWLWAPFGVGLQWLALKIEAFPHSAFEFLTDARVAPAIIAWAVTYTFITTAFATVGFGPIGIVKGTLAAAFQSAVYGAFTPAGGIFATLTYAGMTGALMPPIAIFAAIVATMVAGVVLASQIAKHEQGNQASAGGEIKMQ